MGGSGPLIPVPKEARQRLGARSDFEARRSLRVAWRPSSRVAQPSSRAAQPSTSHGDADPKQIFNMKYIMNSNM